jgi:hypothetical protein
MDTKIQIGDEIICGHCDGPMLCLACESPKALIAAAVLVTSEHQVRAHAGLCKACGALFNNRGGHTPELAVTLSFDDMQGMLKAIAEYRGSTVLK